jgi:glycosyltransferase involved in cell wall biosynthesis
MLKMAMVSSIRPETNYTTYLIDALQKYYSDKVGVLVYTEKDRLNLDVPLSNINLVWNRNWQYVFQVLSRAKKDKVDVIHLQHEINMYGGISTAVLFPLLVFLLRFFGFRPVVTAHAAIPIKLIDRRLLEVFNWPYPKLLTPVVKLIFPLIYFLIGLFAEKVIVHTQTIKKCLDSDYHIGGRKITIIPHGVPDVVDEGKLFSGSDWRGHLVGNKIILYFGYLHKRKGVEYLLRAFGNLTDYFPNYLLVIAGGTIQENYFIELKKLVADLGIKDKVIFTGFIKTPEISYLMYHCDFVVLPAIYSIAASGPLAQVFAFEKPVIVTRIGSYAEEITDGVDGLLVEPGSVESLGVGMRKMITDEKLREDIISAVKVKHEMRKWSKVAGLTLDTYSSLLNIH